MRRRRRRFCLGRSWRLVILTFFEGFVRPDMRAVRGRAKRQKNSPNYIITSNTADKRASQLDLVEEECLPKKQALILTRNPLQSCGCVWACSSAGRAPALQARAATPNTPSFA